VRDGVVAWREEGHCMSAYRGAVRLSRLCDRNDDGNFENQETFDAKNRLSSVCSDSDEDGTCDQITQLDAAGKVISRSFDERHEGRMSRTVAYDSFEHTRERGFDDDGDGRVERSEFFDQRGERQGVAAHRDQPTWEARWFVDGGEIVEHAPQDGGLREMRFEQGGRVVRVQALEATGWVDVNSISAPALFAPEARNAACRPTERQHHPLPGRRRAVPHEEPVVARAGRAAVAACGVTDTRVESRHVGRAGAAAGPRGCAGGDQAAARTHR
jgi:hypothetical protein